MPHLLQPPHTPTGPSSYAHVSSSFRLPFRDVMLSNCRQRVRRLIFRDTSLLMRHLSNEPLRQYHEGLFNTVIGRKRATPLTAASRHYDSPLLRCASRVISSRHYMPNADHHVHFRRPTCLSHHRLIPSATPDRQKPPPRMAPPLA